MDLIDILGNILYKIACFIWLCYCLIIMTAQLFRRWWQPCRLTQPIQEDSSMETAFDIVYFAFNVLILLYSLVVIIIPIILFLKDIWLCEAYQNTADSNTLIHTFLPNTTERGGYIMKEGLMWFIVVAILGTIIPSKGWLAVFVLVVCALGFLMGAIERNAKNKK